MLTLHIEAQTLDQLRAQALAQLGLDLTSLAVVEAQAPVARGRKKAEPLAATPALQDSTGSPEGPKLDQSAPEGSAPNVVAGAETATTAAPSAAPAPVDPAGSPTVQQAREATLRYMTKSGETIEKAPKVLALLKKYGAKLVPDIKPEERAAFIAECDA